MVCHHSTAGTPKMLGRRSWWPSVAGEKTTSASIASYFRIPESGRDIFGVHLRPVVDSPAVPPNNRGEELMRKTVLAAMLLAVPLYAAAQTWKVPAESQRCPSKWGPGDERGSMNHQKP